jgi:hypothetical protein
MMKHLRAIAKGEILTVYPEIKKLVESGEVDLEVNITNDPEAEGKGGAVDEVIDGKLKLKVKLNKGRIVETAKNNNGELVGVVSDGSTIGHEGFHTAVTSRSIQQLKS